MMHGFQVSYFWGDIHTNKGLKCVIQDEEGDNHQGGTKHGSERDLKLNTIQLVPPGVNH